MGIEPSSDRRERAALNQSLFRQVNDRLQELAETFQQVTNTAMFACECAALTCTDQMEMSVDEYEALRSEPNRFAVLPGHVYHDVENVLSENDRFVVVAKIGEGAKVAERMDPRS